MGTGRIFHRWHTLGGFVNELQFPYQLDGWKHDISWHEKYVVFFYNTQLGLGVGKTDHYETHGAHFLNDERDPSHFISSHTTNTHPADLKSWAKILLPRLRRATRVQSRPLNRLTQGWPLVPMGEALSTSTLGSLSGSLRR